MCSFQHERSLFVNVERNDFRTVLSVLCSYIYVNSTVSIILVNRCAFCHLFGHFTCIDLIFATRSTLFMHFLYIIPKQESFNICLLKVVSQVYVRKSISRSLVNCKKYPFLLQKQWGYHLLDMLCLTDNLEINEQKKLQWSLLTSCKLQIWDNNTRLKVMTMFRLYFIFLSKALYLSEKNAIWNAYMHVHQHLEREDSNGIFFLALGLFTQKSCL